MPPQMTVCVCGGGNAAHILIAQLGSLGFNVTVFAPFEDEAERLSVAIKDGLVLDDHFKRAPRGHPSAVSNKPQEVVPQADFVILPLPAFAVEPTVLAVSPHLKQGAWICSFPCNPGFHWITRKHIHKDLGRDDVSVLGVVPMPYNCRTLEYGKKGLLLGQKQRVSIGAFPADRAEEGAALMHLLFPDTQFAPLPNLLSVIFQPANQIIHPARLYSLFRHWQEGETFAESPIFYDTIDDEAAAFLQRLSDENQLVARSLHALHPELNLLDTVPSILEGFLFNYGTQIAHPETVKSAFTSNSGYKGLRSPTRVVAGGAGHVPDFTNRYFSEDIPFGLCTLKGMALIAGVETPFVDELIYWAQEHMGKEYLTKDGKMAGKDLKETATPQRWGFTTVEEMI